MPVPDFVKDIVSPHGGIDGPVGGEPAGAIGGHRWVTWDPRQSGLIELDGEFTAKELRELADMMDEHDVPQTP
jgi:hypothetical protein